MWCLIKSIKKKKKQYLFYYVANNNVKNSVNKIKQSNGVDICP